MLKISPFPFLLLLSMHLTLACQDAGKDQESRALNVPPETDTSCDLRVICEEALLDVGPKRPFKQARSQQISSAAKPSHAGRDLMVREGERVELIASLSYGQAELQGEEVDAYLFGVCDQPWQKLGTFVSGEAGSASGGKVFIDLAATPAGALQVGRYHVKLVVAGDLSTTELYLEVLAKNAPLLVSDIDGTLKASEPTSAPGERGASAYAGAAALLKAFYDRGYFIHYLTARPEALTESSRAWLQDQGFPPGILSTSHLKSTLSDEAAANVKQQELAFVKAKTGLVPCFAFGSSANDAVVYRSAGISPERSFYYGLSGDSQGGHRHSDYQSLLSVGQKAPAACP